MGTNFTPNYAIHPGVFLKEEMQAMKISQKELAEKTTISKTVINEIIHGKRNINAEIAVKLEAALYSKANYWLNLQATYDEAVARKKLQKIENSPANEFTVSQCGVQNTFQIYEIQCNIESAYSYNNQKTVRGVA